MSGVEIRDASRADLDGLCALEDRSFPSDRLSRQSFRRFLSARTARLRVASERGTQGGKIVRGYHLVLFRKGSGLARLYSIAVDRRMRGRGLGRRLLDDAEQVATMAGRGRLRLEVREGNRAAIGLYTRRGYRRIGVYESYYGDGAGALRFEKALSPKKPAGGGR
jgi:ribosomal protein S18 acetylase RimI-like enzyme